MCQNVFDHALRITSEELIYLEESTHLQSQPPLWYKHRTRRITASKFKRVMQAPTTNPPASLVRPLMQESQPDSSKVPALYWKITDEDTACKAYLESVQEQHSNLEYFNSGLHVNPSFLHLRATPEGMIKALQLLWKGVHSNIVIHTNTRSQIQISISSNMRTEKFTYVMTMSTLANKGSACCVQYGVLQLHLLDHTKPALN